jgi:hypothetical protein
VVLAPPPPLVLAPLLPVGPLVAAVSPLLPEVLPDASEVALPPHEVSEIDAPKANTAARPSRVGAEGTARRPRSPGSGAAQKGQAASVVRT